MADDANSAVDDSGVVAPDANLSCVDCDVLLNWTAPIENTDGSQLTDLVGYLVHYGTTPGAYTDSEPASTTSHSLTLAPGTYYFTVTALNSNGDESAMPMSVSKTLQ